MPSPSYSVENSGQRLHVYVTDEPRRHTYFVRQPHARYLAPNIVQQPLKHLEVMCVAADYDRPDPGEVSVGDSP